MYKSVLINQVCDVYCPSQLKGTILFSLSLFWPNFTLHSQLSIGSYPWQSIKKSKSCPVFMRWLPQLCSCCCGSGCCGCFVRSQNLHFLALQRSSSWMFQLMHSHPSRALEQGCWKELAWSWPGAHQDREREAGGKGEDTLWCHSPWAGCHLDGLAGFRVFPSLLAFSLGKICHV